MTALTAYYDKLKVGEITLADDGTLRLRYSNSWLSEGFPLAPKLSFKTAHPRDAVENFLRNLFPEGSALDNLSRYFQISKSNTLALTKALGNETAGALTFKLDQSSLVETNFKLITATEIEDRLREAEPNLMVWDGKPRLSVAGLQHKLPVCFQSESEFGFGEGALASTHILKFDLKDCGLVLNEFFCMQLANAIGLSVAETEVININNTQALKVKRFDRIRVDEETVKRRHIIDGCQALNLHPSYKYERNLGSSKDVKEIREGASFSKLAALTDYYATPGPTRVELAKWAIFNFIIGNCDAHGKNISFFTTKQGLVLAPFYDIVSIPIYEEYATELAMACGDEFNIENINSFHLRELGQDLNLPPKLVIRLFNEIASAVKDKIHSIEVDQCSSNRELSGKIKSFALNRIKLMKSD